ncbi:primase C-terminal domain-containing protein [Macrococcus capreoli]
MYNVKKIYQQILKEGISVQKITDKSKNHYGKIAVANSKEQMMINRGYTCGSIETLYENVESVTHFTPNVFNYLSRKEYVITGHEEKNLKQINAFVVDVDNPTMELGELLSLSIEKDLIPSLVLKTDKGFHMYYILDKPVFVSKKTNFKSLNVAKRISKNLRIVLSEVIKGVDIKCNHFGYFRCPNHQNVLFYDENHFYNFKAMMEWSKEETQDRVNYLTLVFNQKDSEAKTKLFKRYKQVDTEWYSALCRAAHIHAGDGYGRNNTIFTLSLANYQSDVDMDDCIDRMDEFNSNLEYPLNHVDVERIVTSAYSGKYNQASKDYVQALLESWTRLPFSSKAFNGYYKFKKQRKDRIYSHANEREQDIIEYIDTHALKGYLEMSLRDLAKVFNISINALRNALKQSKKVKVTVLGKGRYARTLIYTSVSILKYIQSLKSLNHNSYNELLELIDLLKNMKVSNVMKKAVKTILRDSQIFKETRRPGRTEMLI